MMKRLCVGLLLLACCSVAWGVDPAEYRAVYVPYWDFNTQSECNSVIGKVLARNINAVYVQARGRGDAFYYPNREDSFYPNNEPRGQTQAISPSNFDPLQYMIDKLHGASPKVEVHAWLTTSPSWSRLDGVPPASPQHIYNAHPEWITENEAGTTFTFDLKQ